jgi:hypothetical protein
MRSMFSLMVSPAPAARVLAGLAKIVRHAIDRGNGDRDRAEPAIGFNTSMTGCWLVTIRRKGRPHGCGRNSAQMHAVLSEAIRN